MGMGLTILTTYVRLYFNFKPRAHERCAVNFVNPYAIRMGLKKLTAYLSCARSLNWLEKRRGSSSKQPLMQTTVCFNQQDEGCLVTYGWGVCGSPLVNGTCCCWWTSSTSGPWEPAEVKSVWWQRPLFWLQTTHNAWWTGTCFEVVWFLLRVLGQMRRQVGPWSWVFCVCWGL
jgi:hypothetical protein